MQALYRCIAGMDVHRMLYVLTVLIELPDGSEEKHQRSFGGFKRDRRALVFWLVELGVDLVVMEATCIYWKSIYSTLEKAGIPAHVVNARHVKNVPGRKPAPDPIRGPTCPIPNGWPELSRYGLVKPTNSPGAYLNSRGLARRVKYKEVFHSFIPPEDLRELRGVSRYRDKVGQDLAGEKNRLHKVKNSRLPGRLSIAHRFRGFHGNDHAQPRPRAGL